ncbi:hypothetical protein PFISCL1PPCAC_23094 [Pristionchus fissidentatus]|uniref:Uncharacterized protein n=1 Tax=Pristionchus fissidentatus TaxID=1538716 RepID=A0AAV5WPP8_9BILA|nr:hypothetical protein PFISCL1PPCAC_23094 [Pristionchus fissidentatus]
MSDRASTQLRFNGMVEEYRKRILPKIIANWEKMNEVEREKAQIFHNFYCQLHVVAKYTNVVLEMLAEHERIVTGESVPSLCPSVFTAIKEVARLFGDRSAGMHGCSQDYKAWLRVELTYSTFPSFLGHRFNVVFLLASRVFVQRENLLKFIGECGGEKPELMILAEILRLPLVIEHLQILGLLDQLVTGPLWRLAEGVGHIMETGVYASLLVSWVGECKQNPLSLFSGNCPIPSLQSIASGSVDFLEKLLLVSPTESSLDATVLVMESSLRYFKYLFDDFLMGGQYSGVVSDDVIRSTRCASATNRAIESGFGFIDRLFRHAPNMSIPRREARLMVSKNHTMTWLSSKTPEERRVLVSSARSSVNSIRAENEVWKSHLANEILRRAVEREREISIKNALQVKKRLKAVDAISQFGVVTSIAGISTLVDSLSGSARMCALRAQLRFRERALKQHAPEAKIFTLSHKGVAVTEEELRRRLSVLIEDDNKGALILQSIDHCLVGRSIRRWIEETAEDGHVAGVESRDNITLVSLTFPSGPISFPLSQFETELEEGSFELLDDLL